MLPELSEGSCHARLGHSKQLLKLIAHWCWQKDIYSGNTKESTATKKKDVATKSTRTRSAFSQSLMALFGTSQVVNSTPVWYLSVLESRSLIAIIGTWCC